MNQTDVNFFNAMASSWDEITTVNPDKIGHILDVAKISHCKSVLDVGTGTGVLIRFIINKTDENVEIDAIDVSEGMLNEARRKHGALKNVNFQLVDIEDEQMGKTYDCIMMYCMYPHLTQPEETVEWLAKVNLKLGGSLVIAFPERKESINSIHHHTDGSVHSVSLVDASVQKSRFEARGLCVDYIEDNEEYYIIRITKPA